MTTEQSPRISPPLCRLRAKELLSLPDMRLHLVFTSMLCLAFTVGGLYMIECAFCVVPWAELYHSDVVRHLLWLVLMLVIEVLYIVLAALPMLFGAAMIYQAAAQGKREPLSTLLSPFASFRTYRRALGVMLRLLALPALTIGLCALLILAADRADMVWLMAVILLFSALLLTAVSLLCCRDDAVLPLAYLRPDAPPSALFSASLRLTHGRLIALWRFKLSHIGWALLSVASLGVVLMLHALPYFSLSHTLYLNAPENPDV